MRAEMSKTTISKACLSGGSLHLLLSINDMHCITFMLLGRVEKRILKDPSTRGVVLLSGDAVLSNLSVGRSKRSHHADLLPLQSETLMHGSNI